MKAGLWGIYNYFLANKFLTAKLLDRDELSLHCGLRFKCYASFSEVDLVNQAFTYKILSRIF